MHWTWGLIERWLCVLSDVFLLCVTFRWDTRAHWGYCCSRTKTCTVIIAVAVLAWRNFLLVWSYESNTLCISTTHDLMIEEQPEVLVVATFTSLFKHIICGRRAHTLLFVNYATSGAGSQLLLQPPFHLFGQPHKIGAQPPRPLKWRSTL